MHVHNSVSVIVKFCLQGEEVGLSGAANLKQAAGNRYAVVRPGQVTMYNVEVELHRSLRGCDGHNEKLSACLKRHLDRRFGTCQVRGEHPTIITSVHLVMGCRNARADVIIVRKKRTLRAT